MRKIRKTSPTTGAMTDTSIETASVLATIHRLIVSTNKGAFSGKTKFI